MNVLERLRDAFARSHGARIDVAADPSLSTLPAAVATAAYRIVQEALANVARHARATSVGISAAITDGTLLVVVEDNGVGIARKAVGQGDGGYGLEGMRERASLVRGSLRSERPTAGGTRVTLEVLL